MGGLRRWLTEQDQRVLDHVAGVESRVLDRVLPPLGVAANYSRLWLGFSAVLVMTGRPDARRAAVRGLVGVAVASATANVLAKGVFRRVRPVVEELPAARHLRRATVTTSFPSGHAASAAAFATGVSLEMPALAVGVGGLATAVAASRVVTGAHYPSDVVAGAVLGIGVGSLTVRWWRRGTQPRAGRRRCAATLRGPVS
jgi:undecaprenyl-diphosphatase